MSEAERAALSRIRKHLAPMIEAEAGHPMIVLESLVPVDVLDQITIDAIRGGIVDNPDLDLPEHLRDDIETLQEAGVLV